MTDVSVKVTKDVIEILKKAVEAFEGPVLGARMTTEAKIYAFLRAWANDSSRRSRTQ